MNIEDNMSHPEIKQIMQFFQLAKQIGVESVTTNPEQLSCWKYIISSGFQFVHDDSFKSDVDTLNGIKINTSTKYDLSECTIYELSSALSIAMEREQKKYKKCQKCNDKFYDYGDGQTVCRFCNQGIEIKESQVINGVV